MRTTPQWIACLLSLAATAIQQAYPQAVAAAEPGEELAAFRTVSQWEEQRAQVLADVQLAMGPLPSPDRLARLDIEVDSTSRDKTLLRKKISYQTDHAGPRVRAWLLIPSARARHARRGAAVLCLHQTTGVGKDEPAGVAGDPQLAYARELAELGFVTLSPDYPSFGEYDYNFETDDYDSGSMKAIYDNIRAVDVLSSLPEVDPRRIGAIGHSLGGHNAIFTAVFEPRLRAVVSSCGFTRFHKYYDGDLKGWTSSRYMPRIAQRYQSNPDQMPFDFTDLIAALAPRAFLAVAPQQDHNFEVSGVRDVMAAVAPIYRLYSAENKLQALYPDCAHEFPPADRQRAYEFLTKSLAFSESQ